MREVGRRHSTFHGNRCLSSAFWVEIPLPQMPGSIIALSSPLWTAAASSLAAFLGAPRDCSEVDQPGRRLPHRKIDAVMSFEKKHSNHSHLSAAQQARQSC